MTVVDKPHRLPSMAHESNAVEHCGGCAERSLGLPAATLKVTHRLDSSTSGVLVLGKTESAVREFNESVAKKPGSKVRVSYFTLRMGNSSDVVFFLINRKSSRGTSRLCRRIRPCRWVR
jgi:23S rRNA-/tRNA-specific pseudouridylate synthase